ncbi:radical SAM protein [Candidatus Woesearchaeota archaeon]|nr:radical SAM protein [Candidatus Woesearchaeota archaeon]
MQLKQICKEILREAKKKNINDSRSFNKIKLQVLNKYKLSKIPKNATIASVASEKDRSKFKKILSMKPVRTLSGVATIALMTEPYPCPHAVKGTGPCIYCPGGPGSFFGSVPQSYTGKEPSARRAIRNYYDPYLGVFNRLEHYIAINSVPEKAEVILQGGTFPFFPGIYQEYFVKYIFKAMNDFSGLFYKKNKIDMKKFNRFFEMPAEINDKERAERIQRKLFFMKNIDLSSKRSLDSINNLFFKNNLDISEFNNSIKNIGIKNKMFNQWKTFNEHFNKTINNDSTKSNNKNKKIISNDIGKRQWNKNSLNANISLMKGLIEKIRKQDNPDISLKKMQKENETARIRCVGLTIETRSDYGKLEQGNQMLRLGCTRVELGIQSIYDNVLKKIRRGCTAKDNIESIRTLKDLGFKINLHYMPGLPYTTKQMDRAGLKELFANPDYRPDMLKIYPCMVMQGTKLYDDWKAGKFKPLATKEAAELIAEMKKYVPEWCRIMRVQRDIPTYATSSGVDRTNLRQYVEKVCKARGIKCRCIRCREAGLNIENRKINFKNIKIK